MKIKDFMSDFNKTVTLLCVEDDEDILKMYRDIFSIFFKKVYFATNGVEGVEVFKNEAIDIVLTDYMMPVQDGLQMSATIRKIDASVPIILVTALDNSEVLREALNLHITSFLSKPFTSESLINVFNTAVKSVLADRTVRKEQKRMLDYSLYQERLSFEKERLISQNDLTQRDELFPYDCKVFYRAHDILSGDSYSIRKLNHQEYVLSIIDGMGKGISASVTAMLCSSALNHYISEIKELNKEFKMREFLEYFFKFIQPTLLEEESVSLQFIFYRPAIQEIEYSIYAMPPILYVDDRGVLHKIRSNNPPLGKYGKSFNINTLKVDHIQKALMYSDGLSENSVDGGERSYAEYLQEHFLDSQSVQEFEEKLEACIPNPEDDITYIYLQK